MRCGDCQPGGEGEALGLVIERLEAAWLPAEWFPRAELHWYEPLRVDHFLEALEMATAHAPGRKYLEVGCGIGTKLVLARSLGLDVTGIEIREPYVAAARYLSPETNVLLGDARGFDNYRDYDIVYAYRPVVGEAGQAAFEEYLARALRTDAVLISPLRDMTGYGFAALDSHRYVWRR